MTSAGRVDDDGRDDEFEQGRPWAGRADVAEAEDDGGAAPPAGRGTRGRTAEGKLGEALIECDLLQEKVASLEANRPFGPLAVQTMSRAVLPMSGRPYGPTSVCRIWQLARSTIYRHRTPVPSTPPRRADAGCRSPRGDPGGASRRPLPWRGASQGLGPAVPWQYLHLQAPGAVAGVRARSAHPLARWHATRIAYHATRFETLEPLRQGVRCYFGSFAKSVAHGLAVRHNHGSPYMSHDFHILLSDIHINILLQKSDIRFV